MATVTIGTNTYDSFESVDDADEFLAADASRADAWDGYTTDQKGRGLVSATRRLLAIQWCDGVPDIKNPPQAVADATAMYAADILADPDLVSASATAAGGNGAIKRAQAGSASVEYFANFSASVTGGLPASIWDYLRAAGLVGCAGDDSFGGPYVGGIRYHSHFEPDCAPCDPRDGVWPWC